MSEQMEKLVEEIASIVRGETSYSSRNEKASISMAKVLIDITLKAVVDGMPLLGEVGRGFIERTTNEDRVWWATSASALERYPPGVDFGVDFIALSPSGIPVECKEEKK